jgi:general transcription factor IIIA
VWMTMKRKANSPSEAFEMSEASATESDMDPETPGTEPLTPVGSGRKILPCPYQGCQKAFNRQARLTEHIRSHTNERPFNCPEKECGKAFLRDSHLKHHIKSAHTNERDYSCTWANCNKKFATGTRLRRHESSHEAKEQYTCKGFDGCNETFRKHATLSRHILAVHENKKPFPCTELDTEKGEQCSSGFDTAEKLRAHKRAVHDHTRFVCMDCPPMDDDLDFQISFTTYALLQKHIAEVHPPTCPQCSLLCASEKDLRRHLELSHNTVDAQAENSKASTYFCTFPNCTRSFTKKGNLNVHVKTVHEHRKEFVCGETELKLRLQTPQKLEPDLADTSGITGCGRHFTSKATLEEHVRTVHLGMNSKRQERNQKRQAEKATDFEKEDAASGGRAKKRGKTQVAKSTIAKLTGSASLDVGAQFEADSALSNPFDGLACAEYDQDFHQVFDAQPLPQQGYEHFFMRNESGEESFAQSSLEADFNGLAASALLDPAFLAG